MAITATGMSAPQRVTALAAANQYSAAPTVINQNPMQPQVQPVTPIANYQTQSVQNLPAYGLAGSEQALNQFYGQALSGMQGGIDLARNELLNQSDLGRKRLNLALQQSQGFGQQALESINNASNAASGAISSGMGNVTGAFDEGVSALNQFLPQGVNAYNTLGNYLGLGGTAAQAQAMQNYMESPEIAYQREQAQKAILQNARAVGGVGGNALLELSRDAQGRAAQGYNNYLDRLTGVANTGYGAAQGVGSLRGQQAGIVGNLASQQAQNEMQRGQLAASVLGGMGADALGVGNAILGERQNLGSNLANLAYGGAGTKADYAMNMGSNIASGRQQAGRDISAIQQAQGQNYANMLGANASNIAQLLSGVGDTINSQQGNLANIISNLATNSASTAGNQTSVAQFMRSPDYVNQLSQVLAAAGAGYQYGR